MPGANTWTYDENGNAVYTSGKQEGQKVEEGKLRKLIASKIKGGGQYTVETGDSASTIAEKIFGDQRYFDIIQSLTGNRMLKAGQVIDLSGIYVDTTKAATRYVSPDAISAGLQQGQKYNLPFFENIDWESFVGKLTPSQIARMEQTGVDFGALGAASQVGPVGAYNQDGGAGLSAAEAANQDLLDELDQVSQTNIGQNPNFPVLENVSAEMSDASPFQFEPTPTTAPPPPSGADQALAAEQAAAENQAAGAAPTNTGIGDTSLSTLAFMRNAQAANASGEVLDRYKELIQGSLPDVSPTQQAYDFYKQLLAESVPDISPTRQLLGQDTPAPTISLDELNRRTNQFQESGLGPEDKAALSQLEAEGEAFGQKVFDYLTQSVKLGDPIEKGFAVAAGLVYEPEFYNNYTLVGNQYVPTFGNEPPPIAYDIYTGEPTINLDWSQISLVPSGLMDPKTAERLKAAASRKRRRPAQSISGRDYSSGVYGNYVWRGSWSS